VSMYSISLFLHIVGALGLFAVLGLEWAGLYNLRRASRAGQVREWVKLLATPRFLGTPSSLLILVTGIHMSATRWGPRGWIVAGLVGMVVIAALAAAVSGRRIGAVVRGLPAEEGPISTLLGRQLHDPVLALSLWLRTALFLGIVFVMSIEPSTSGVLAAMGVALVVGLAAAVPSWSNSRRPPQVAQSQR
jgi:hypothetical protein